MAREKKEYKPVSIKMALGTFEKLETYCAETRLSKTAAIEIALLKLFEEHNKKEKK